VGTVGWISLGYDIYDIEIIEGPQGRKQGSYEEYISQTRKSNVNKFLKTISTIYYGCFVKILRN